MQDDSTSPTFSPTELLTDRDLATALKVSARTPETWRNKGIGPRFIRLGRRQVRYRWADVLDYLENRSFASTAEEANAA